MSTESAPDFDMIRRMTANDVVRRAPEMAPIFHFLVSDASVPLTGSLVGCHDGIPVGFSLGVMSRLASDPPDAGEDG